MLRTPPDQRVGYLATKRLTDVEILHSLIVERVGSAGHHSQCRRKRVAVRIHPLPSGIAKGPTGTDCDDACPSN